MLNKKVKVTIYDLEIENFNYRFVNAIFKKCNIEFLTLQYEFYTM